MAMTESATRKRVYSKQSEMSPSWGNSPFAPFTNFGLANGSEMVTPPSEKRLRTEKKTVSTFKWEPDVPGKTQFSAGYGFRGIKVRTPSPAVWQDQPSRGYATPPEGRFTREKYEGVKQELMQRSMWFAKLDKSATLAEDALDRVGRPRIGLDFTAGPTQLYFPIYNAKRELEDFKRVAHAVHCLVPLSSNGKSPAFTAPERMRRRGNLQQGPMNLDDIQDVLDAKSQRGGGHSNGKSLAFSALERMRRRGSNLQQGRMNLDDIQDVLDKKSQRGGGHWNGKPLAFSDLERMRRRGSNLQLGPMNLDDIQDVLDKNSQRGGGQSKLHTPNEVTRVFTRTFHEDAAQPEEELQATGSAPESSSQTVAASIEVLDDDDVQAHDSKEDKWKESWELLKAEALNPVRKSWSRLKDKEIAILEEKVSRLITMRSK